MDNYQQNLIKKINELHESNNTLRELVSNSVGSVATLQEMVTARDEEVIDLKNQLARMRVRLEEGFSRTDVANTTIDNLRGKLAELDKLETGNRKTLNMLNEEAARHLKEIQELKLQNAKLLESRTEYVKDHFFKLRNDLTVAEQMLADEKNKNDHLEEMYAYQNDEINILRHNIMRLSSNQLTAAQKEKCDRVISEIERLRDNG